MSHGGMCMSMCMSMCMCMCMHMSTCMSMGIWPLRLRRDYADGTSLLDVSFHVHYKQVLEQVHVHVHMLMHICVHMLMHIFRCGPRDSLALPAESSGLFRSRRGIIRAGTASRL